MSDSGSSMGAADNLTVALYVRARDGLVCSGQSVDCGGQRQDRLDLRFLGATGV